MRPKLLTALTIGLYLESSLRGKSIGKLFDCWFFGIVHNPLVSLGEITCLVVLNVTNGVRQGGILSPVLFSVYMDDLSVLLNSSKVGCVLNGITTNHLMYADDTCLLAPSPAALQQLLRICSEFAISNSVVFNESKTKLMCYRSRFQSSLQIPDITLNGLTLTVVHEYKYLGILLQSNQSDESDMKRHVKGIYTRGNMLVSRFKNCSANVKKHLFQAYCSNAYGSQLWSNYKKSMYQKVKVAYNDVYRK